MPISKALLLGTVFCGLSACEGGFDLGVSRAAPERVQLADGLIVAGADGWCVDSTTSRRGDDRVVVVLGSCAAIAGTEQASPDVDGVVTVSVDADDAEPPSLDALESFFGTEAGRAALARNGQANSIDILDMRESDGILVLHAADESVAPGIAPDVWRALFDLQGRFVSISLFGVAAQPISPDLGRATLANQVDRLRAANANTDL